MATLPDRLPLAGRIAQQLEYGRQREPATLQEAYLPRLLAIVRRCAAEAALGPGYAGCSSARGSPRARNAPGTGTPTAARILASSSAAVSGCSRRNSRALSLPWPIFSPLYAYHDPDLSTMLWVTPNSM